MNSSQTIKSRGSKTLIIIDQNMRAQIVQTQEATTDFSVGKRKLKMCEQINRRFNETFLGYRKK